MELYVKFLGNSFKFAIKHISLNDVIIFCMIVLFMANELKRIFSKEEPTAIQKDRYEEYGDKKWKKKKN